MKFYWNRYIQKAFWMFTAIGFLTNRFFVFVVLILGLGQLIMNIVYTFNQEAYMQFFDSEDKNTYLDKFINLDEQNKKIANILLLITWICFMFTTFTVLSVYSLIAYWIILACIITRVIISILYYRNLKKLEGNTEEIN